MESVISDQTSPLSEHAGVEPGRVAEHYQAGGDSEQQVNGMDFGALNQSDAELHRFCSEGNLDEVRVMLSRSLEGLESLGERHCLRSR